MWKVSLFLHAIVDNIVFRLVAPCSYSAVYIHQTSFSTCVLFKMCLKQLNKPREVVFVFLSIKKMPVFHYNPKFFMIQTVRMLLTSFNLFFSVFLRIYVQYCMSFVMFKTKLQGILELSPKPSLCRNVCILSFYSIDISKI
jgi:hypothetical protein